MKRQIFYKCEAKLTKHPKKDHKGLSKQSIWGISFKRIKY